MPIILHNTVWAAAIALVGSGLIRYHQYAIDLWLVILSGVLAFNLGAWFARNPRISRSRGQDSSAPPASHALVGVRELVALLALFLVGLAAYLVSISSRFGLGALLLDPEKIRATQGVSYLQGVPLWSRLAMYLGVLLIPLLLTPGAIQGNISRTTRLVIAGGVSVGLVLLLQRSNLISAFTVFVVAFLYLENSRMPELSQKGGREAHGRRNHKGGPVRRLVTVAAIVLVGLAVFQGVGGALGKTGDRAEYRASVSPLLSSTGLTSPFIYASSGVPAFLSLVDSNNSNWPPDQVSRIVYGDYNPQTWGGATLEPFLDVLPLVRPWNSVAPFTNVGVTTNVYTWLEPLFRDFRILGVALGSGGLGFICAIAYRERNRGPTIFWISSILGSMLLQATFAPRFNSTMYIFLILTVLLLRAIRRK